MLFYNLNTIDCINITAMIAIVLRECRIKKLSFYDKHNDEL